MEIPKTQRGYVLTKERGLIYCDDLEVPQEIPEMHLLMKIKGVSICGTDFGMMKADPWTVENVFPHMRENHVLGHEFFGEIVKKGPNTTVPLGAIGACESHYPCPECYKQGIDGHSCPHYGIFGVWGHKISGQEKKAKLLGGAFAEYIMIPEINFYDVSKIYRTFHCSLIEPSGNTWKIAEDLKKRGLPETLLIFGAGPHGLNLQSFASFFGVKKIVIVEPADYRRGFSRGLGAATVFLKPEELTKKAVEELTGDGFDAIIDCVGIKQVITDAINNDFIKNGGIIGLFGLPKGTHQTIETEEGTFLANDFIFKSMEAKAKTPSGRSFTYVGYTGRTHHALVQLINALEQGKRLQENLQRQLRIVGPLNMLKDMLKEGFPGNISKDELKIGFTAFE